MTSKNYCQRQVVPDMGVVSRMLALRIDLLVPKIFPNAKRVGSEWCVGSLAGEPGRSLSIHTGGVKSGVWSDFSAGQRGDALDLVAEATFCGDRREARSWALSWLGFNAGETIVEALSRKPSRSKPSGASSDLEIGRPCSQYWRRIWDESLSGEGTLVESYLNGRGLNYPAEAPIRFHALCPCAGTKLPAMVALMTDAITNEPVGNHRTFLAENGLGKAQTEKQKMMLGHAGVVRLIPDEYVTRGLGIAEGIETALAIMQYADWKPVWAATSAVGICNFPVLAGIESLTIFADHDAPKPNGSQPGVDAARECALRWQAAGRHVTIQKPPQGFDWDEALNGKVQ